VFAAEPNPTTRHHRRPECVPIDIFNGIRIDLESGAEYVAQTSFQQASTQEQVISGSVTAIWANMVSVALGEEPRRRVGGGGVGATNARTQRKPRLLYQ